MANYIPTEGIFTIYQGGGNSANHSGDSNTTPPTRIASITDSDGTNQQFTTGDTIMLTFSGASTATITAKFLGTTTEIEGGPYIVLEVTFGSNTFTYVVGTGGTATAGNTDPGEKVAPATVGGLNIDNSAFTVCFFPGTLIATPSGERRVEDLVPGDPVLVDDAGSVSATWIGRMARNLRSRLGYGRAVPVKFLGRQTVSTRFAPAERLMPVRFAAGSLGGGGKPLLPHSGLTVTADHAMLVDGVLCQAGALVNGTTITRVPLSEFGESYTVYHVETDVHEIILANGAPTETFVDNVSRRAFDNHAEFVKLHGDQPEMKELPHPRASNARHLPLRIKSRLGIGAKRNSAA